jgi:hypothetical protein
VSYYAQQEDWDDIEAAEIGDWDEAVRRRATPRRPSPITAARPRPYITRPQTGPAPAREVSTAFERVGTDVRTLATQVKETESEAQAALIRQTKAINALRADLQQTKLMSVMLPLLNKQEVKTFDSDVKVTVGTDTVDLFKKGDKLVRASSDTLSTLLPMMMLMGPGMSGQSSDGEQSAGGFGNPMMMMVMALVLSERNKST